MFIILLLRCMCCRKHICLISLTPAILRMQYKGPRSDPHNKDSVGVLGTFKRFFPSLPLSVWGYFFSPLRIISCAPLPLSPPSLIPTFGSLKRSCLFRTTDALLDPLATLPYIAKKRTVARAHSVYIMHKCPEKSVFTRYTYPATTGGGGIPIF